jgi:hypothetical protein
MRDNSHMTLDEFSVALAKAFFDWAGIYWPENYQEHVGELLPIIAAALAEARAQALREAAEVAEAWGAGDERNGITPVEFDRRYGVHLHLAAAIRALTSPPPSDEAPHNHSPATRP